MEGTHPNDDKAILCLFLRCHARNCSRDELLLPQGPFSGFLQPLLCSPAAMHAIPALGEPHYRLHYKPAHRISSFNAHVHLNAEDFRSAHRHVHPDGSYVGEFSASEKKF
jgi:hypothetical protein